MAAAVFVNAVVCPASDEDIAAVVKTESITSSLAVLVQSTVGPVDVPVAVALLLNGSEVSDPVTVMLPMLPPLIDPEKDTATVCAPEEGFARP
jgi:hypothetical protein